MKKLLVAVFVIIVLPALVLFYFAMNSKSEKRSTYKNYNDVSVSSEEDSPEYILGEPQKQLCSPLQKLCVNIDTDENGTLFYTVSDSSGLLLLDRSYIGIKTDQCDFSQGLSFVRQTPAQIHDEKYTNISGKRNISRNYYSETVLTYERDNFFYDVYLRAYEDGFAYRSGIRSKDSSQIQLSVEEETGSFSVPPKSSITAELVNNIRKKFCYENIYSTYSSEALSKKTSSYVCFPALISVADSSGSLSGKYLLLSEADMVSFPYHGSVLSVKGSNVYGLSPAPVVKSSPTAITTDFLSPWRFGIYGNAGDIAISDMAENLLPRARGDYSWVKPGVTAWTWLSERIKGQNNPKTIKQYIDLSAEMGWSYLILDEGWQPKSNRQGRVYEGYYSWFDDILQYANDKGIGLIIWIKYADLDTPDEREVLREYADKGIKGIKADFFDSEDQTTMSDMNEIYRICSECHLLVNCHGASKPAGERGTYPNVINREAVKGEEYGGYFVNQAVIWAFTRNVIGPMDLTPRVYPKSNKSTLGLQLASCVILESGMPCMAGSSKDYRTFNGASFYKNLPAAWDDTVFLGGDAGDYITMARRSGDVWYVATITKDAKKGMSLPLKFLGEGEYEAVIYSDANKKKLNVTTREVNKYDILTYDLLPDSGYVVKLTKKTE